MDNEKILKKSILVEDFAIDNQDIKLIAILEGKIDIQRVMKTLSIL